MTDPQQEPRPQRGHSKEAWAGISAIAVAILDGIVMVLTTFYKSSPPPPASTSSAPAPSPAPASASVPPRVADLPLGGWSGTATVPSGSSFRFAVRITQACRLHVKCGVIAVPQVPCKGELTFVNVSGDYAEFDVSNFDASSDPKV